MKFFSNMMGGAEKDEYSCTDIDSHGGIDHNQWLPRIEYGSARSGK
jgi:hypothetical protein